MSFITILDFLFDEKNLLSILYEYYYDILNKLNTDPLKILINNLGFILALTIMANRPYENYKKATLGLRLTLDQYNTFVKHYGFPSLSSLPKININDAKSIDLMYLPNFGNSRAVDLFMENKPYHNIDDLRRHNFVSFNRLLVLTQRFSF